MAKKILTVDDSKTMRDMVSFTLKGAGFDVVEAEDGVDALAVLDKTSVDLIITDINMPNMDGVTLVKRVRGGWCAPFGAYSRADHGRRRAEEGRRTRCRGDRLDRKAVYTGQTCPGREQGLPLTGNGILFHEW